MFLKAPFLCLRTNFFFTYFLSSDFCTVMGFRARPGGHRKFRRDPRIFRREEGAGRIQKWRATVGALNLRLPFLSQRRALPLSGPAGKPLSRRYIGSSKGNLRVKRAPHEYCASVSNNYLKRSQEGFPFSFQYLGRYA